MTTVIRATGGKFINTALKNVSPLFRDGLVAAFRPNSTPNGLDDISVNGVTLTKKGNPVLLPDGVAGDYQNGYEVNVTETESITMLAAVKLHKKPDGDYYASLFLGNFKSGTGIPSVSLYVYGRPGGVLDFKASAMIKDAFLQTADVRVTPTSDYFYAAMKLDAATNAITLYVLNKGVRNTVVASSGTIAGRPLLASDNRKINILSTSTHGTFLPSNATILEVLIYNRALSDDDVYKQYGFSKSYWQSRGINF